MARNIQTELRNIADVLRQSKRCSDLSPIEKAITSIKKRGVCTIEQLKISLPIPPNTIPNSICRLDAIITISIGMKNQANEFDINHLFETYEFNVLFIGYENEQNRFYSSFHLDYDSTDKSKYLHPWFHLTFGGHVLKNMQLRNGNLMLLPTPRIPLWPMDFIIGIDFILSNFLEKTEYFKKFASNSNYQKALKNSQDEIWRPYILSLAHHWCKFGNCQYNMINQSLSQNYVPTLIADA